MLLTSGFQSLKQSLLSNYPTSGADICGAGRITVDAREKD